MQREIKFRGFSKHKSEWWYGNLNYNQCLFKGEDPRVWIAALSREAGNINQFLNLCHFTEVFPDSVGQYTGLKDKNGKEIYEGDIVEYFDWCYASTEGDKIQKEFINAAGNRYINKWNPLIGVVKWNNEIQTYEPTVSCQEDYNNNCFAYVCRGTSRDYPDSYYEVIGNIYQNKDLYESITGK